jgi:hypothetical protein
MPGLRWNWTNAIAVTPIALSRAFFKTEPLTPRGGAAEKISFLGLYIKDLVLCFLMKSLMFVALGLLLAFSSPLMAQEAGGG